MKKATKGTIVFRAVYFSLLAAALAAITAGLIYLWQFLADYEATLPEKLADEFVWRLNSGIYSDIYDNVRFEETIFESREAVETVLKERLEGEFSYSKLQRESTEEEQVYKIKCGGEQVAVLILGHSGEVSPFGFPVYEQKTVETFEISPRSVTVTALNSYEVFVNGTKLDDSFIVKQSEPVEQAGFFHGYLEDVPYYVTYTVEGLLLEPETEVFDSDGTLLSADESGVYGFREKNDQELIQMGLDFSKLYTEYIANDVSFNTVSAYIPEHLPLYEDLYYYEGNFYSWHSGYEFTDEWAGELYFYGENCISVRSKYNHTIYYTEEKTFPIDNTVYFAKADGEWKVTDVVMNFGSDSDAVVIGG